MEQNKSLLMDSLVSTSKSLMMNEPFYGYFLISLNKSFVDNPNLPTAGVSREGINTCLEINPTFWSKLSKPLKIAVLKHEMLHIVFFHLTERENYSDHGLFNIAADLEINQYIENEYKIKDEWMGLELSSYPELKLPAHAGTRVYYDLLNKINKERDKSQSRGGQEANKSGADGETTSQDLKDWFDKVKNGQTGSGNDGSSPTKSKLWDVYDAMSQGHTTQCNHDTWKQFQDGLSEADKKLINKQTDYQIKDIINANGANNTEKGRGFIPGELKEYINDLFKVKDNVINWKEHIRRFVGHGMEIYTKKTRYRPNIRFGSGPSLKIKEKKHLLVAIDTSGSVSTEELNEFFSEIYHLYKTGVSIDIIECDAKIGNTYPYKGETPEYMSGRGGTSFNPVIDYYDKQSDKYTALLYLTDMECTPPKKPRNPMMWVISTKANQSLDYDNFPGFKIRIKYK